MTDEEIEKGLRNLSSIDLNCEANYDSCGRLIPPRGMAIIHATLDYINRLKENTRDTTREYSESKDNSQKHGERDFGRT